MTYDIKDDIERLTNSAKLNRKALQKSIMAKLPRTKHVYPTREEILEKRIEDVERKKAYKAEYTRTHLSKPRRTFLQDQFRDIYYPNFGTGEYRDETIDEELDRLTLLQSTATAEQLIVILKRIDKLNAAKLKRQGIEET